MHSSSCLYQASPQLSVGNDLATSSKWLEVAQPCQSHPDFWPTDYFLRICFRLQRAMGEFGAVSVISGNIIGKTQTLTLFVESSYKEYNNEAAFSASVLLCVVALISLIIKERIEREFLKNE